MPASLISSFSARLGFQRLSIICLILIPSYSLVSFPRRQTPDSRAVCSFYVQFKHVLSYLPFKLHRMEYCFISTPSPFYPFICPRRFPSMKSRLPSTNFKVIMSSSETSTYDSTASPNVHLFLLFKNFGDPGSARIHSPCLPLLSTCSNSPDITRMCSLTVTPISCPNDFYRRSGPASDSSPTANSITCFTLIPFPQNFVCSAQRSSISRPFIPTLYIVLSICRSKRNYVRVSDVSTWNISRSRVSHIAWLRLGPSWILR